MNGDNLQSGIDTGSENIHIIPAQQQNGNFNGQAPETVQKESYFDGSTAQYIGWSILAFLLTAITLGIAFPWAMCMKERWRVKHTVIDGKRLTFTGKGIQLFGKYILWCFLTVITLGIYSIWFGLGIEKWKAKHTIYEGSPKGTESVFDGGAGGWFGIHLLIYFLSLITLGIYSSWGTRKLIAWKTKHTIINGVDRLAFHGRGGRLFIMHLLRNLLGAITLGIYLLFWPAKYLRWEVSNTHIRTSYDDENTQPKKNAGLIIGIVFAVIAGLAVIAFAVRFVIIRLPEIRETRNIPHKIQEETSEIYNSEDISETVYIPEGKAYIAVITQSCDVVSDPNSGKSISFIPEKSIVTVIGDAPYDEYHYVSYTASGQEISGWIPEPSVLFILNGTVTSSTTLNVRTGPGKGFDSIGELAGGQTVYLLSDNSNGWYNIFGISKTGIYIRGWVSADYVSVGCISDDISIIEMIIRINGESGTLDEGGGDISEESSASGEVVFSGEYKACTSANENQIFTFLYIMNNDGTFTSKSGEYRTDSDWEMCGGELSWGTYSADKNRIYFHIDDIQHGEYDTTYYYRTDGDIIYLGKTKDDMVPYCRQSGNNISVSGYHFYRVSREGNEITVYDCEFKNDGTYNISSVDYSNIKYDPFPDVETDKYGWYVQPKGYDSPSGNYYSTTDSGDIVVLHSHYYAEWGEEIDSYNAIAVACINESTHTAITSNGKFYISRESVEWESICNFFGVSLD